MESRKCIKCGKEFTVKFPCSKQKYCCRECAGNGIVGNPRKRFCQICGKEFKSTSPRQKTCSRKCGMNLAWNTIGRTREERKCLVCGKPFFVQSTYQKDKNRGKYCSVKCYQEDHKAKIINYICRNCGKEFNYNHKKRIFCSDECVAEYKEKSWKKIRLVALNRDNYTCQKCGIKDGQIRDGIKIKLEVHHLDETGSNRPYAEMNNRLNNLVSFCHKCHMQIELEQKGKNWGKEILSEEEIKKRNEKIYDLYIKKSLSQSDIAKMFNITRQRVNQIICHFI